METLEYIEEFKETFLPDNFVWRKGQKEAILGIVDAYRNKAKVVLLDAPVGSGKSIIAMASSWILNELGAEGYMLASDIALQEQYEKDFNSFNLGWGSVKGIDNYKCIDNFEKNSLGTCRVRNKSPKGMHCYNECPYFCSRDKASKSPTSLLNYAYWLIMQNYVNQHGGDELLFPARDFTICDEAHKILDIVQSHYSPRVDEKMIDKLEKLTHFLNVYKIKDHFADLQTIKNSINLLFDNEDQQTLYNILAEIELNIESYLSSIDKFKDKVKEDYPNETPPKEWRESLRISDWLKDFHCKLEDYVSIIYKTSVDNLIKNPSGDNEIIFNCLEESYLMNKYFHDHSGFTVLMSATFADPSNYLRSLAIKGAKYIKVHSSFNFDKSPIYFYNKRRMSYKEIDNNLPWMYETIDSILSKYPNQNGIIHSASYNLTMKIHQNLSKENKRRILVYEGTAEKRQVLDELKRSGNKILMGPSLLEGLDLKGDLSRVQIVAKVPYLSLADKFVKTKLSINPEWYQWKAIINILQGVGRSVRDENDWADTYILDAGLADLIHRSRKSFPNEFLQRIKVISE